VRLREFSVYTGAHLYPLLEKLRWGQKKKVTHQPKEAGMHLGEALTRFIFSIGEKKRKNTINRF